MNSEFFLSAIRRAAGSCREWVSHGRTVGYRKVVRLTDAGGGMPEALAIALDKRGMEKTLLDKGFSLRLAKIAAAAAFSPPANP